MANGKVGTSPLDLAMCSEWRGFADKFRTMISAVGVRTWRDFEDGLYDVPANADGTIGFEAFEEFLGVCYFSDVSLRTFCSVEQPEP